MDRASGHSEFLKSPRARLSKRSFPNNVWAALGSSLEEIIARANEFDGLTLFRPRIAAF